MTNQDFVEKLISDKTLQTPRIINAFKAIDRKDFVLSEGEGRAYEDRPLSIGFGATISQPTTIAIMLEKLQPEPTSNVLEVGTGSGYLTALLAKIVWDSGEVFSIEYIPELKEFAKANLKKYNFRNVSLFVGDGKKGLKEYAPFDKIISSASGNEILKEWKRQLKIGGRIVAPVDDNLIVLDKLSKRKFKENKISGFIFVPLQ
ncbi:MAG: protein-L-isoaspartate(D-aspartate) O-methyltransferase [Parcubacteria group bacterium Gr01-1014_2]|nr:MAG: protein-L-isoaspartate(D-aspartate) O-methyltransferase [Parcubacteria group bacterium Gr01-1014_2]